MRQNYKTGLCTFVNSYHPYVYYCILTSLKIGSIIVIFHKDFMRGKWAFKQAIFYYYLIKIKKELSKRANNPKSIVANLSEV